MIKAFNVYDLHALPSCLLYITRMLDRLGAIYYTMSHLFSDSLDYIYSSVLLLGIMLQRLTLRMKEVPKIVKVPPCQHSKG